MASAGNIILNLPTGGKGPYRVAPQGRVFYAQPPQTMQNIAGTLKLVQEAKKVADAVAPFLASEYRPPEQQIDIAQRRSEQAQKELEAARLRQMQTAKGVDLPPVADPSVQKMLRANEMLQQAQTPEQLAEAQRLYAESQAESKDLQSAASDIAQARRAMMEARKEEIDPAAQRAAFERQSLAAAPPRLPTFDTLAQAEAAIAQAKAMGNYQAIGPMLQGLQYSALRDVAPSNAMETMNPLIARRNAIQGMLQRLKLPAELTPQRAALQRSAQDIARSRVAATKAGIKSREQMAKDEQEWRTKHLEERHLFALGEQDNQFKNQEALIKLRAELQEKQRNRELTAAEKRQLREIKSRLKTARINAWSRIKASRLAQEGANKRSEARLKAEVEKTKKTGNQKGRQILRESMSKQFIKLQAQEKAAQTIIDLYGKLQKPNTDDMSDQAGRQAMANYNRQMSQVTSAKKALASAQAQQIMYKNALEWFDTNPTGVPPSSVIVLKKSIDEKFNK